MDDDGWYYSFLNSRGEIGDLYGFVEKHFFKHLWETSVEYARRRECGEFAEDFAQFSAELFITPGAFYPKSRRFRLKLYLKQTLGYDSTTSDKVRWSAWKTRGFELLEHTPAPDTAIRAVEAESILDTLAITREERACYLLYELSGWNFREIAALFGFSLATAQQNCHRVRRMLGKDAKKRKSRCKFTVSQVDQMVEARLSGVTLKDIADKFGASESTVYRLVLERINYKEER